MESAEDPLPHSALYFDALRDYWWNLDYLELIADRLELGGVRSVLDVGAGVGHWGRTLAAVLSDQATFVGVDRESQWVADASQVARERRLDGRFRYEVAAAEQLPFADASFDLVTCQTVLIHVSDPRRVLREMIRTVKPGGCLLLAEPNNLASQAISSSVSTELSIEQVVDRFEFALTCERGKEALGEGNISVGDLLPGYLAELGAEAIHTYTSDKASAMFPPYESPEQRELRAAELVGADSDQWIWPRDQARRYFLAGGGTAARFELSWNQRLSENRLTAHAVTQSTFHTAGGTVHYLIAARRPAPAKPA